MKFFYCLVCLCFMISCKNDAERSPVEVIMVNHARLDAIRSESDTGYTRVIGAAEFNMAEQYVDRGDSTISKIMKDTAGRVIAFVQFRNNIRITYQEYYSNGQLKARLPLNAEGEFDGPSKYYYQDGRVKSEGVYSRGLFTGKWKNYSENGRYTGTDEYDRNGQLVKSVKN